MSASLKTALDGRVPDEHANLRQEHPLESTRRTFLKQAAGLSAACMVGFDGQSGAEAAAISAAASNPGTASWYERPMRWAQLSFVEDDPGNYDMQFWRDYSNESMPMPQF